MFTRKSLEKPVFLYLIIVLGACILSFGLYNIHERTGVTEGGVLGMTLLLQHWFGLSPAITSPVMDIACYLLAWHFLGNAFAKYAVAASLAFAASHALWEQFPPLLPDLSTFPMAAAILGDLLKMQEEPIVILAALGSQLRRLYTARMAIDSGKDKYWLMELWEMRSDYPAKLLLQSAKRVSTQWCGDAVKMCQVVDLRMKSQRGADPAEELKLLLARLGAARK